MNINKVEWVDILGNPIGTTEERYEKLAKQIEEYNKKKEGKWWKLQPTLLQK